MAQVIFKRKTTAEINELPIVDGQLIWNTETGETYIDIGTQRILTGGSGADGKSAYQIWLEQGNTGTEEEFLDSLNGNTLFKFEDITEVENGYYYGSFTHNSESAWECIAKPIECKEGDIFRFTSCTYNINDHQQVVKCYGSNQILIGSYCGSNNGITNYTDKIFVVPQGVTYIAFNCWKDYGINLKVEKAIYINDIETQIVNSMLKDTTYLKLYGKSLYCDGDSIADGAGSKGVSYAELLRDKYNMQLTNVSKGGTTIAINEEINQTTLGAESIYERITAMTGNYDFILFEGGTNDVSYIVQNKIELGTITEGFEEEFDTSTTLGALESICHFLNINYFDTQKLFVFVNSRIDSTLSTSNLVFSKMKEVLEKWGIPYIDISKINNLGNWNDTVAKDYFHSDKLHPNLNGYKKFYLPYIEKALIYGGYINSPSSQSEESNGNISNISIETGSKSLDCASTGKINSASCEYQKINEWVDMHIYVDLTSHTLSSGQNFVLGVLPFTCGNDVTVRELCITTGKNQLIWAVASNSKQLTFIANSDVTFTENEKLSFSIRYKVSE